MPVSRRLAKPTSEVTRAFLCGLRVSPVLNSATTQHLRNTRDSTRVSQTVSVTHAFSEVWEHFSSLVHLPKYFSGFPILGLRQDFETWGRYHGGRRLSSDDSFHSPTVIPPSALDKGSIMKRYHRRRTCSHTSPRRSPTMVTLHDNRFVECRWWNDCWTVKTVVT